MKEKQKKGLIKENQLAHKRYKRFFRITLRIAAVVFIVSFLWVTIEGYHRLVSREVFRQSAYLVKPLKTDLDKEVFNEIESRKSFSTMLVDQYYQSSPTGQLSGQQEGTVSGEQDVNEEENN